MTICLSLLICLKKGQRPEEMEELVLRDTDGALALVPL